MDRGLKERLVGAAVLVAIGAWLIPWVLDGPQQLKEPESTSLELPAPSATEEPPMRTETLVLDRRDSQPVSEAPVTEPSPAIDIPVAEPERVAVPAPVPSAAPMPTPDPPARSSSAPARPAATDASSATRWLVQLGAFGDQANAERLAARVATFGYEAEVSAFPSSGRTVYRVRVGPEDTRARAEAIASALSAHGFVAQVVFE